MTKSIKDLVKLLGTSADVNDKFFKLFPKETICDDSREHYEYWNYSPLQWACAYGKRKLIQKFLDNQLTHPSPLFKRNLARALIAACKHNRISSARLLIQHEDVNVNYKTKGTTPFLYACRKKNFAFVQLFVENGMMDYTALNFAVTVKDNSRIIDYLYDANCNPRGLKLMLLCHSSNIEHIVRFLPDCSNHIQDAFDHAMELINSDLSDEPIDEIIDRGEYLNRLDILSRLLNKPMVYVS